MAKKKTTKKVASKSKTTKSARAAEELKDFSLGQAHTEYPSTYAPDVLDLGP